MSYVLANTYHGDRFIISWYRHATRHRFAWVCSCGEVRKSYDEHYRMRNAVDQHRKAHETGNLHNR